MATLRVLAAVVFAAKKINAIRQMLVAIVGEVDRIDDFRTLQGRRFASETNFEDVASPLHTGGR